MTTGATYYVQMPLDGEATVLTSKPYPTLPKAQKAADEAEERLKKLDLEDRKGVSSILVVKVMETRHLGVRS